MFADTADCPAGAYVRFFSNSSILKFSCAFYNLLIEMWLSASALQWGTLQDILENFTWKSMSVQCALAH